MSDFILVFVALCSAFHASPTQRAPRFMVLLTPRCNYNVLPREGVPSPTRLLDQTQSFGSVHGGTAEEDPSSPSQRSKNQQTSGHKPLSAVKNGSLDDILANREREAGKVTLGISPQEGRTGGSPKGAKAEGGGGTGGGWNSDAQVQSTTGEGQGAANPKRRASLDEIMGIKVGNVVKGSNRSILQEGDVVEVLVDSPGGASAFSPGVISRVHDDGCVDVDLETGAKVVNRMREEVRLSRQGGGSSAASVSTMPSAIAPGDLEVGDRVEAR